MELKLEITEELSKELKEIADAQLMTKEDIARRMLACHVLSTKQQKEQKPRFFGFDLEILGQTLQVAGAQLIQMTQEKGK